MLLLYSRIEANSNCIQSLGKLCAVVVAIVFVISHKQETKIETSISFNLKSMQPWASHCNLYFFSFRKIIEAL